jgi:hypothetical protein
MCKVAGWAQTVAIAPLIADVVQEVENLAATGGRPKKQARESALRRLYRDKDPGQVFMRVQDPRLGLLLATHAQRMAEQCATAAYHVLRRKALVHHAATALSYGALILTLGVPRDPGEVENAVHRLITSVRESAVASRWTDRTRIRCGGTPDLPPAEVAARQSVPYPWVFFTLAAAACVTGWILWPPRSPTLGAGPYFVLATMLFSLLGVVAAASNRVLNLMLLLERRRLEPRVSRQARAAFRLASQETAAGRHQAWMHLQIVALYGMLGLASAWLRWPVHALLLGWCAVIAVANPALAPRVYPWLLVLGRSGDRAAMLFDIVRYGLRDRRSVTLMDLRIHNASGEWLSTDCLRQKDDRVWQNVVRDLAGNTRLILFDARGCDSVTKPIQAEADMVLDGGYLEKTIWIVEEDQSSSLIEEFRRTRGDEAVRQLRRATIEQLLAISQRIWKERRPPRSLAKVASWLLAVPADALRLPDVDFVTRLMREGFE